MDDLFYKIFHASRTVHKVLDTGVISAAMITFFGWLPDWTAFFALVYLLIRIWETDTLRGLTKRTKSKE